MKDSKLVNAHFRVSGFNFVTGESDETDIIIAMPEEDAERIWDTGYEVKEHNLYGRFLRYENAIIITTLINLALLRHIDISIELTCILDILEYN